MAQVAGGPAAAFGGGPRRRPELLIGNPLPFG